MKINDLLPGDCVSIDQYISTVPGRCDTTSGKEKEKYVWGTIFVNYASQYVFAENQRTLTAGNTFVSKCNFEKELDKFGVTVKKYRADNQPFRSKHFVADIVQRKQTISYSGVGAHHQNGIAEVTIKTITSCARTMCGEKCLLAFCLDKQDHHKSQKGCWLQGCLLFH